MMVVVGIILIILGIAKMLDAPYGGAREFFSGLIMMMIGGAFLDAVAAMY